MVPLRLEAAASVFVVFRTAADRKCLIGVYRENRGTIGAHEVRRVDAHTAEIAAPESGTYHVKSASGRTYSHTVEVPEAQQIGGSWAIAVPVGAGAPKSVAMERLVSWTEHPDDDVKYFSGTATYRMEFVIKPDLLHSGQALLLDLGGVKEIVEVFVNDRSFGILWKPQFVAAITEAVREGINRLELRVTNLWPNRLTGGSRLPRQERVTWTNYNPYTAASPLLDSGLFGPVLICASTRFTIVVD